MILRERKPAKELSLKRRHTKGFKLTANDQVKVEKSGDVKDKIAKEFGRECFLSTIYTIMFRILCMTF